jgi:hypothetical protein
MSRLGRLGSTAVVDLSGLGDQMAQGYQLAQRDAAMRQQAEQFDQRHAAELAEQAFREQQHRESTERYAASQKAMRDWYSALSGALAGDAAMSSYGQQPGMVAPSPVGPRPSQVAEFQWGNPSGMAPGTPMPAPAPAPQLPAGGGVLQNMPAGAGQPGSGPVSPGMMPPGQPATLEGRIPHNVYGNMQRQSLAQRIMASLPPGTLENLPPTQQRELNDLLGGEATYIEGVRREQGKIKDLLGANMFRYYIGGPKHTDPAVEQEQIEALVDELDRQVALGMLSPAEVYKGAHPSVREALGRREDTRHRFNAQYMGLEYMPDGSTRRNPDAEAFWLARGPRETAEEAAKKFVRDQQNKAKWQAEAAELAAAAAEAGVTPEQARALGATGVRQLVVERMRGTISPAEFQQRVTDKMSLFPGMAPERAQALVREELVGRRHDLPEVTVTGRPKIGTGKASTVITEDENGEQKRIIQGNGEVIRWGPGNQWTEHFRKAALAQLPEENLPGTMLSRNLGMIAAGVGGAAIPGAGPVLGPVIASRVGRDYSQDVEAYQAQREADLDAKARELAEGAGFIIEGGSAPQTTQAPAGGRVMGQGFKSNPIDPNKIQPPLGQPDTSERPPRDEPYGATPETPRATIDDTKAAVTKWAAGYQPGTAIPGEDVVALIRKLRDAGATPEDVELALKQAGIDLQ